MTNLLRCLLVTTTLWTVTSFAAPALAADTQSAATAPDYALKTQVKMSFSFPWAMAALPDGRLLVTEKTGKLKIYSPSRNQAFEVKGVPKVAVGGQGGLGDVIVDPNWSSGKHTIYLSYAEADTGGILRGAAVASATLSLYSDGTGALSNVKVIWRQPKVDSIKQYGLRLAFSNSGKYLFISSGDRALLDPAQDKYSNLGKVIRIFPDGRLVPANPFYGQGSVASQIFTMGHRNILGLAVAPDGRLWAAEMGPWGGDEFNLIVRGYNYGWPLVSEGKHYDGTPIPKHRTRPDFAAPRLWWTPVIAPGGMIFYSGNMFPNWRGDALIAGLKSKAIIRVHLTDGLRPKEAARYPMENRIREIEQGADGALWVLEDLSEGKGGRLLRLTP